MRTSHTLVLEPEDLSGNPTSLEDVSLDCVRYSYGPVRAADVVVYIDRAGDGRVLKNRYGELS